MLIKQFFTAVVMNKTGFALFTFVFGWVLLNIWAPDQIGETNLNWQSGTEFIGTMRHENTEDRVWEFPRISSGAGTVVLEDNEVTFTNKSLSNFRFNDPEINNMRLSQVTLLNTEPLPVESGGFGVADLTAFFNIQEYSGTLLANHFADNSILTESIVDNAIITNKILNNAITIDKIGSDVTTTVDDNSVTSAFIEDGAVTSIKLADNGISGSVFIDNAVRTVDIQDSIITTEKIANNTISSIDIADGTVELEDLNFTPDTGNSIFLTEFNSLTAISPFLLPERARITGGEICFRNESTITRRMVLKKANFDYSLNSQVDISEILFPGNRYVTVCRDIIILDNDNAIIEEDEFLYFWRYQSSNPLVLYGYITYSPE